MAKLDWDTGGGEGGGPPIGRSIFAGEGLVGGGDLSEDRTISAGAGNGIILGVDTIGVKLASTSGLSFSGGDLQLDDTVAGGGLSIGSKILSVSVGNGLQVDADAVKVKLATTSGLEFATGDLQIRDDIAGAGLSITNKILAVGAGTLMTVAADSIGLSVGSAQYQVPMTGAITFTPAYSTATNNPGAAIALLRTDANGILTLVQLDTDQINDKSGGNIEINPSGDIILAPEGLDVLPNLNYTVNLGLINKKYLTLHAAELWVETLVAQNTIATIGGRILVIPTNILIHDIPNVSITPANNSFETAGGGGADVFANWAEVAGTGTIVRYAGGYSGSYCAALTAGGTTAYPVIASDAITVVGERVYGLSFFQKPVNITYQGAYRVYDVTNSADIIAWKTIAASGTGTFTEVYESFVVPKTCTQINIQFRSPTTNTYCHYFDYVFLQPTTFQVKYNNFASGDIAYMEAAGNVEWVKIDSSAVAVSGGYEYKVTRNLDGSGLNFWYAGDAIVNTGVSGDGYIDLYSISSVRSGTHYGPSIVGNIRTGTTYSNLIEAWAVGNLNGIYGYNSDVYGAAFGRYAIGYNYITIEPTSGIQMKSNRSIIGEKTHVKLNLQGDFFLGSDISAAASTNLAVFNVTQTWNSESMGSGDLLLGDNSSLKANLLWDKSEGTLLFRTGTTANMTFNTDGSIRVGATGNNYALFTSTSFIFRTMSDVPLLTVDGATPEILLGLPQVVKVNEYGLRLDATGTTNGKLILGDNITSNDNGMFYIGAGYAATGEFLASLKMPTFTGSAGMYNDLQLYTGSVKGSGTIGAGLELYSGYSATTSFAKITIDDTMVATFGTAYTQLGSDLRLAGGMTVGFTDIDPASGSILMLEISAPGTPTSTHGVLYTGTDGLFHFKSDGGIVYEMPIHTQDTDYFSGSSKVGWTSYTTSFLSYARIGNLVFVHFYIAGTSNNTATTFTVPFANGEAQNLNFMFRAVDNGGSSTTGTGALASSSSTVTLYKDATGGVAWTNTGTKAIYGHFVYWV